MKRKHPREDDVRTPMAECVKGRVYKIRCRNLAFGAYDGKEGFIGIRTKFGSRYLATEFHWDQGEPYGTVSSVEDIDIDLPDDILVETSLGIENRVNGRRIINDKTVDNPNKGMEGKKGWWVYEDTGDTCPTGDDCRAADIMNKALFEFLENVQKNHDNSSG